MKKEQFPIRKCQWKWFWIQIPKKNPFMNAVYTVREQVKRNRWSFRFKIYMNLNSEFECVHLATDKTQCKQPVQLCSQRNNDRVWVLLWALQFDSIRFNYWPLECVLFGLYIVIHNKSIFLFVVTQLHA